MHYGKKPDVVLKANPTRRPLLFSGDWALKSLGGSLVFRRIEILG
jgi:hypothetical protein